MSLEIFFERSQSFILSARRKSSFHSSDHFQIFAHFFFISTSTEEVTEEVKFSSFLMVPEIMKQPIICVGIHKNRGFRQSKKSVENQKIHCYSWMNFMPFTPAEWAFIGTIMKVLRELMSNLIITYSFGFYWFRKDLSINYAHKSAPSIVLPNFFLSIFTLFVLNIKKYYILGYVKAWTRSISLIAAGYRDLHGTETVSRKTPLSPGISRSTNLSPGPIPGSRILEFESRSKPPIPDFLILTQKSNFSSVHESGTQPEFVRILVRKYKVPVPVPNFWWSHGPIHRFPGPGAGDPGGPWPGCRLLGGQAMLNYAILL